MHACLLDADWRLQPDGVANAVEPTQVRKSRKIKNTVNPEWKQEFEFHCQDEYA